MEVMDSKIVESSVARVRRELGYIASYESNLRKLKMEFSKLGATRDCVQYYIHKAQRKGELIEQVVLIWQDKVDVALSEAKKLIYINNDVHVEAKQKYCLTYFPNLCFMHQQSKKYLKMTQDIHQVLIEANFPRISHPLAITGLDSKPSKPSTPNEILKEIKNVLKDPNIYMIGLYGIEGVGKTTLVKELALEVEKDQSFEVVVFAEVTDSPDVENIQRQIANALGMKRYEQRTRERTAELLYEEIRKKKSILFILDDIWEKLDLKELGIPFGDDHKGCKLLLTSENRNVLKRQMGTQKDFKLDVLSDEDSWKLFEKIACNDIQRNNLQSIAQDVAKCCDGFPLFIVAVAKALRGKDVSTWENALNQLKKTNEQGLPKEYVCPLELSYHCLRSDELKSFCLFIASVGLDCIHDAELFFCYRGLHGDLNTLTETRNKYYKLISDLKASSLLLEGEIENDRMHAVVRDTIKAIGSATHPTYEVQKFTQMVQWDLDKLRKCHYINLPSYDIDELPEKLDCPELKIMSLRRNHGYLAIPDDFFSGMRKVKVLNLHGMKFSPSPPTSLRLLRNLISLNLYGCLLGDIALVAKLKSLKILILESSEINELPKEIGQLVYLQMLNLTNCRKLQIIPANVLSRLTRLEELYMGNCDMIQWEVERGKSHASVRELSHLYQLRTLYVSIQDASLLPTDMDAFSNLQRYNIFIGKINNVSLLSLWLVDDERLRTLTLSDSRNTNIWLSRWVHVLLTTVEYLSLDNLNFGKDKSSPKALFYGQVAMPNLQILELRVRYLHKIWDDKLPVHFYYPNLRILRVRYCPTLKSLFSASAAIVLSKLQNLEIKVCHNLEEIFVQQQEVTFPNLETLIIHEGINLKSIWDNQQAPNSFCKLKIIEISECHALHHVLPIVVAKGLPQLEVLKISFCDNIENIVENTHSHDTQDEVASTKLDDELKLGIEIKGDDALADVASMNLEELKYKTDELGEIVFNKFQKLVLEWLPEATSFCKGNYNFNFPVLETVQVIGCKRMKTFCNGNIITPNLSKVRYRGSTWKTEEFLLDGDLNSTLESLHEKCYY